MTMTPVLPTPASRPPPAFMPWYVKPGDRIGEYTICTGLGVGSGGVVYDVQDPAGGRFALKLSRFPLAPTGRPSVQCDRFQLSAMAHLALNDVPNVAKLIGFNTFQTPQGAFPYLVMELVPGGETITAWAQRTSPSLAKLVSVFIDIATALGTLADMKICHRDLKPQNLLVAPGDIPKIVDFNSVAFPAQKTITYPAASAIPGTLAYFSPELAAAVLAEIRTRIQKPYAYAPTDDLYALGAVFYEVLTGELPCCQLDEPEEVMLRQIVGLQPVRLHELNPSIPWPIGKVVTKLLRKDPRERYQSGHEVAADLQAAYRGTADGRWQEPFIVGPCEANPTLPLWLVPSTPIAPADLSTEKGHPPSTPAPAAPAPEPKAMSTCHILYIEGSGLPEALRKPEPIRAEGEAEVAAETAEIAPAAGEPAATPGSSAEVAPPAVEAPSEADSSAAPPVTAAAAEWQPVAEPDSSPAAEAQPRPAERPRRRWAVRLAVPVAVIVIAGLVAWLYLGQHCPAELSAEKGSTVLCKAKLAVVGAASTALSCVGLMNVRAADKDFFHSCPAEARETVKLLDISNIADARFLEGPNVRNLNWGYALRAGPVEAWTDNARWLGGGILSGEIRTDSNGASVRFTRLKLLADPKFQDGMSPSTIASADETLRMLREKGIGYELPVCAVNFESDLPGFTKMTDDEIRRLPPAERNLGEGFFYLMGRLDLDFASDSPPRVRSRQGGGGPIKREW